MVLDFIGKGEKLMLDENCPKFLDGHVQKLREAWDDTNAKAQIRKKALTDNLNSWEIFETQKIECHKHLDAADSEFDQIKKIFDLSGGPADHKMRMKTASNYRKTIEEVYNTVKNSNDCLQQMLPEDKKAGMNNEVNELTTRCEILTKTDEKLVFIDEFNQRLNVFDVNVTELENWLDEGNKRLDSIKNTKEAVSPEDRVTKAMEVQEDITKKTDFCSKLEAEKAEIFPKAGEKVSSDCKKFVKRIEGVRAALNKLEDEVKAECAKFSEDVKYFAEYQTCIKAFDPWLKNAEKRKVDGLKTPTTLVEACEILGSTKNFQDECDARIKLLDEASVSAGKMGSHADADQKIEMFRARWVLVHQTILEWLARMTTLVECWNKLDGNVGELSSWVTAKDSSAPDGASEISIEKLETQLLTLKTMFEEKQRLVADLEAYGSGNVKPVKPAEEASTEAAPVAAPETTEAATEEAAPENAAA